MWLWLSFLRVTSSPARQLQEENVPCRKSGFRSLCNIFCMPKGPICLETVVRQALCVTIPICLSKEPFMHRVLCVTVTFFLCTTPVVSQGLLCHKVRYVIWSGLGFGPRWKHIGHFTYRACDATNRVTQRGPFCDLENMVHVGIVT